VFSALAKAARPTRSTPAASLPWPCAPSAYGRVTVDDASVVLRHLLLELVPGGAKKDLSAPQARPLLDPVKPRDMVGKTRGWPPN
jgi:hypothetical protein